MLLLEVVGKADNEPPVHISANCVKEGITVGVIVKFKVAVLHPETKVCVVLDE